MLIYQLLEFHEQRIMNMKAPLVRKVAAVARSATLATRDLEHVRCEARLPTAKATKLQYLRCDPNLPPQNTGDRCRAGTVDPQWGRTEGRKRSIYETGTEGYNR